MRLVLVSVTGLVVLTLGGCERATIDAPAPDQAIADSAAPDQARDHASLDRPRLDHRPPDQAPPDKSLADHAPPKDYAGYQDYKWSHISMGSIMGICSHQTIQSGSPYNLKVKFLIYKGATISPVCTATLQGSTYRLVIAFPPSTTDGGPQVHEVTCQLPAMAPGKYALYPCYDSASIITVGSKTSGTQTCAVVVC